MKSNTRTVLATTITDVSTYSSGPLDVGDLDVLLISLYTTSESGTNTCTISAVDANGNLVRIATIAPVSNEDNAVGVGNSSTYTVNGTNTGTPYFGDQIQIDIASSGGISAELSVKGK
jgi:hypothetical protein